MNIMQVVLVLTGSLIIGGAAHAVDSVDASVQVECTGRPGAKVAIRWGHPNYNVDEYMPLFTIPCGVGMRNANLKILDRNSQFEVQTEGGIDTSYAVKVTLGDGSSIQLNHVGSPGVSTAGKGFAISRSSGPNRFGEQNFRVQLQEGMTGTARIVAQTSGDRNDAKLALRWGHPDFHEHEYFPTWTVKAGAPQEKKFPLRDNKSEFEIQTEGGEGTGYHLSIWLDLGRGEAMQPSIAIAHKLNGTSVVSGMNAGDSFVPTKGNAFGEMNVRVGVPALPDNRKISRWTQVSLLKRTGPFTGGAIPYVGQLGLGLSPLGHFLKVRSAENFDVELVGGGGATTDDCGKANGRTRLVRANQDLPDGDFRALFGQNPTYPTALVGCSYRDVLGFSIQVYTAPD